MRGGRSMQRYCTTGQGASGPEGWKGGGEESPPSSERSLVSSQPCQQEPVTHWQHWARDSEENMENESSERRKQGNTLKDELKVNEANQLKRAVLLCVGVRVCLLVLGIKWEPNKVINQQSEDILGHCDQSSQLWRAVYWLRVGLVVNVKVKDVCVTYHRTRLVQAWRTLLSLLAL